MVREKRGIIRGFEWFVAWRHLRDPDRGRQVTLKVGIILLGLAVLAYALSAWWLARGATPLDSTILNGIGKLARKRWLGQVQNVAVIVAIAGGLIAYLGLLFRWFTVFTAFSIFGVFLGTAAPIFALSVMSGFEGDLKTKIRGSKADVLITREADDPFTGWREVVERVRATPGVTGVAPFVEAEVMLMSGRTPAVVYLRGIEPASAATVLDLGRTLREGKLDDLVDGAAASELKLEDDFDPELAVPRDAEDDAPARAPPPIFLGQELYARVLRVFTGDLIDVICPLCAMGPTGPIPRSKPFEVKGRFYSGMYEYDVKIAYVHMKEAQRFLGLQDEVTGIDVRTATPELAGPTSARLQAELGSGFRVRSWEDMNQALFLALKLEKIVMFVALAIIVLVASFSIVSNLFMLVTEKGREVAILKAMGASDRGILRIFLAEGLYIGVLGMGVGLVVGIGSCVLVERLGLPLPSDIYYIERLPVVMRWSEIVGISGVAIGLSVLAALFPARLASRLHPVEGLRYE